jgi:uncharacterized protein (TIGR02611 family)
MNRPSRGAGDDESVNLNDSLTPDPSDDHNVTLDAADDDWRWRRTIRSNPHSHLIYRIVVGMIGLAIVALGLVMVPFPGPGWLVVFLGLAVWSSEFEWAQRLLRVARRTLRAWTEWLKPQSWWIKCLVLLVTIAAVAAIFWLLFLISGVPRYLPDLVETWLTKVPGLGQ